MNCTIHTSHIMLAPIKDVESMHLLNIGKDLSISLNDQYSIISACVFLNELSALSKHRASCHLMWNPKLSIITWVKRRTSHSIIRSVLSLWQNAFRCPLLLCHRQPWINASLFALLHGSQFFFYSNITWTYYYILFDDVIVTLSELWCSYTEKREGGVLCGLCLFHYLHASLPVL